MAWERNVRSVLVVLWELLEDGLHFISAIARSRTAVAAEVLFLRKQLAYYQEHQIRPVRQKAATRAPSTDVPRRSACRADLVLLVVSELLPKK